MGDVKFNSSGGGSVTLTPPSTASNLTVTLPSTSGTLLNTGATSFTFAGAGTISATTTLTLNGGAGSNGLVLDASNNVGIGVAPTSKLTVGSGSFSAAASNSTGMYTGASGLVVLSDGFLLASRVAGNTTLVVDTSGNLGLGVTPSGWATLKAFSVGGTGSSISGNTNGLYLTQSAYYNAGWKYSQSSNPAALYQQVDNVHSWHIAASGTAGNAISWTQAMTLDASGRLIVGNTSQLYGFSGRLYTEASSSSYLPLVALSSYSGDLSNPAGSFYKYDNNSTTSQVFVRFAINNGGAGCGQINGNGAAAAAFGSFSDSRLKENITALPNQLANICALKPSEFDYKDGSGHQIGFIAQEMQEVYPDVVGEGEDGMLTITGWSKTEARLVKAIQELSAKNSELESRLAALEGK